MNTRIKYQVVGIKYRVIGFLLFVSCYLIPARAQTLNTDSLKQALSTAKEDTNKVNALNAFAMDFRNNDPDMGILYATQAKELAGKLNFKRGIAEAYLWMGISVSNTGRNDEALSYLKNVFGLTTDPKITARTYNTMGAIYHDKGSYDEAFKNLFAAVRIEDKMGNKQDLATSHNNIGAVYYTQNNYTDALKNYYTALKIYTRIGHKQGIAASYNNIGLVYYNKGNLSYALKNYTAALQIRQEIGDKAGTATSFNNLGLIYADQHNYAEALKNFLAAIKMQEEIGDKQGITYSCIDIGNFYFGQKKTDEAKQWFQKGLDIAKEIGSIEAVKECYKELAHADSTLAALPSTPLGKKAELWQSAYLNYLQYKVYNDSLYNEENTRKNVQLQMQLTFDKKQAEDSLKVAEERKLNEVKFKQEKTQRFALYGGLVLVLIFAVFMFNRFRITHRQKLIIEQKEKETQEQKQLIEAKQKEIVDSIKYASRIQQALITNEMYIERSLRKLKEEGRKS